MNYIPLDDYKKAWVFRHQDAPVSEQDLALIKPMSHERAAVLWSTMVSREHDHPDFFDKTDWCGKEETFTETVRWEDAWEEGEALPPEEILAHLDWQANTTVYFCMARDNIIETSFDVFKRNWQNFMFLADGSLLLGKKRDAVVQFLETGDAKLGNKPA
ncbi:MULTISPECIES: DUF2947 domain-containing protein [unclassified Pseudoalteromonas]|uniref:DUF2947 domain-containing protein n=1 Tax=unclassified Pseudoalteromonas TaxID=194690 RepID=UPI000C08496E|nr:MULTISPECIES: DUF2947 domain-containing protein [unclassified Pseudoalteromonas]MDP2634014.1 DUF2947 domain-containing protein [Pseudoalteromonas sp. 1_MG-2023]PHN90754.1 hypothetical protein CSC79_06360 [Pseudoalteromonas sp. 3D05]